MLYMISSRSVTDGVSLSVIKSKMVYNSTNIGPLQQKGR